jgi:hypothetical protein
LNRQERIAHNLASRHIEAGLFERGVAEEAEETTAEDVLLFLRSA